MNQINNWTDITVNLFKTTAENIVNYLPKIGGALIVIFIGWIITKIIVYLLRKTLKYTGLEKLSEKITKLDLFEKTNIDFKITDAIIIFVKWIIMLIFLIIATNIMEWDIVSKEISNLLRYLPKLFSAIALFMIGLYIAKFVKKAIQGFYESFDFSGARVVSNLVFYIIAIIISITALNQAGIDTSVITNNVTIILGAFLLTFAIGFGLGSKEVIKELLLTFYTRKNYEIGDTIRMNNLEGKIESIDNICVTLITKEGKSIIPIKEIVNNQVDIIYKK